VARWLGSCAPLFAERLPLCETTLVTLFVVIATALRVGGLLEGDFTGLAARAAALAGFFFDAFFVAIRTT
jgi:hypothetical protein